MLANGQWQDVQVSWALWQASKKPYYTPWQCSHLQVLPELYFLARSTAVPLTGLLSSHAYLLNCKEKMHAQCFLEVVVGIFFIKPQIWRKNIKQKLQTTITYSSSFLQTWAQTLHTSRVPRIMVLLFRKNGSLVRTNHLLLEIIFQPCIKLLTLFINNLCLLKEFGVIYHN